jgi:hypothetical protein
MGGVAVRKMTDIRRGAVARSVAEGGSPVACMPVLGVFSKRNFIPLGLTLTLLACIRLLYFISLN